MRRIRPLLLAGSLVLAIGLGTTIALTTRPEPLAAPAGQPTASPAAAVPGSPTTTPASTTPEEPGPHRWFCGGGDRPHLPGP